MDLLVYLLVFAYIGIAPFVVRYRRRHRKIKLQGTSLLLTYYSDGASLTPLKNGTFGELHYVVMAGFANLNESGENSVIYQIALPFSSRVHLVGIPQKYRHTQLDPTGESSIMEPVVLEGDYPQFFTLYAEKGMQTESRYVLDPSAMVFTIEFCQSFSWEIVDNQLYVVHVTGSGADSKLSMSETVLRFIEEIKPAIASPLTEKQLLQVTPYSEEYRKDLQCPICSAHLKNQQDFVGCPHGDGVLLKGGPLTRLHAGTLEVPRLYLSHATQDTTTAIDCPGCGNRMEKVKYNGGKTLIDVCLVCPYRWLDASDNVQQKRAA